MRRDFMCRVIVLQKIDSFKKLVQQIESKEVIKMLLQSRLEFKFSIIEEPIEGKDNELILDKLETMMDILANRFIELVEVSN